MRKSSIFFLIVIGLLCFYAGNVFGQCYTASASIDVLSKLVDASDNITVALGKGISLEQKHLLWGLECLGLYILFVLYRITNKRVYMPHKEHGSAEWAKPSDISKLIDKKYQNNILLTQTERISLNTRKTRKNDNVLVVGGSGSGKTRFYVKPNLMQLHSSYVITDPKGTVLIECGKLLANNGYRITTFNTIDFSQSLHYNPFSYIEKEEDILTMIDLIIKNCKSKDAKEDFWVDYERLLYQALFGYVYYVLPPEERTFEAVMQMLRNMQVREEDEGFVNPVDCLFADLKKKDPNNFAVLQYDNFKLSAGKTAKSVLTCAATRLAPFNINAVKELTAYDDMHLDKIGSEKTALFIIIDDTSSTYNFLAAMLYTQLFNTLCNVALKNYGGRLPIHVRCILDEFANIGQIPNFEKIISVIRSREISVSVILQNIAQLKAAYKDNANTIMGNCDTTLFLGSGEVETAKLMSERVGKTTIDHRGTSTTKGQQGSFSMQDQIIGRELITAAEVSLMKDDECLLFIRGVKPFKSKKFNIKSHKNYKKLSDYSKANQFNLLEYRRKKEEDEINCYIDSLEFDDEI